MKIWLDYVLKRLREEVEYSDSVDIQVIGGKVRNEFPEFPVLQQSSI